MLLVYTCLNLLEYAYFIQIFKYIYTKCKIYIIIYPISTHNQTNMNTKAIKANAHRIGAVAALSGVPVPTLRGWETRYDTFSPQKSEGGHRLYGDDDVLRATLLKRLTEQGHAISSVAQLDTADLNGLLQKQTGTQLQQAAKVHQAQAVTMAVIGLPLASRIASQQFKQVFSAHSIHITDIFESVDSAKSSPFQTTPQFLLVRVTSVHAILQVELHRLIEKHRISQVIVLYHFGQEQVVQAMRQAGMMVRREPVSDHELGDLIGSALFANSTDWMPSAASGLTIPMRKYNDETLARVAAISTNVLCECPRHVAEIIGQLASFEQYSQECLNKSADDAHLHACLRSVSGSARALFEQALEMVAKHEGIDLTQA